MSDERFDPWRTLGIQVGAGPGEVRAAWRRLARRMHPDVRRDAGAHDDFIRLRQAYETLIDDELRARLERRFLTPDDDSFAIIDDFEVTLGDAYELLERGYTDEARALYLDLARDHAGDERLLKLVEAIRRAEDRTVRMAGPARPRVRTPREPPRRAASWESYREMWTPAPTPARWWLGLLAFAVVAGCGMVVRASDAPPVLQGFSALEIGMAALAGFAGALLAAAGGLLRSFDFELGGTVTDRGGEVPLWLYLGVAGLISPALALIFYLVIALFEAPLSWRVLAFFAGVYATAAALAWAHGGQMAEVLTFGASVVFLPALAGWAIGSIFRPGHWWE